VFDLRLWLGLCQRPAFWFEVLPRPVDISGSRLPDVLHISKLRDFPRVNLAPFGSNNRSMIQEILIALLLPAC